MMAGQARRPKLSPAQPAIWAQPNEPLGTAQ